MPLVVLARHKQLNRVPIGLFDVLELCGPLGAVLASEQRESLEGLWKQVCSPQSSEHRANLPERCDRAWFEKTFCGGNRVDDDANLWAALESINIYGPLAIVAAEPAMLEEHFTAFKVEQHYCNL